MTNTTNMYTYNYSWKKTRKILLINIIKLYIRIYV